MAEDGAVERFDRDSIARAGFLARRAESAAIVVAIGFAIRVELAGAFELAAIAAKRAAEQPREEERAGGQAASVPAGVATQPQLLDHAK